jgi:hypothetical protein
MADGRGRASLHRTAGADTITKSCGKSVDEVGFPRLAFIACDSGGARDDRVEKRIMREFSGTWHRVRVSKYSDTRAEEEQILWLSQLQAEDSQRPS